MNACESIIFSSLRMSSCCCFNENCLLIRTCRYTRKSFNISNLLTWSKKISYWVTRYVGNLLLITHSICCFAACWSMCDSYRRGQPGDSCYCQVPNRSGWLRLIRFPPYVFDASCTCRWNIWTARLIDLGASIESGTVGPNFTCMHD